VINIILDCEQLLSILAPCRWATNVENIIRDIFDACVNYMSEHFSNLIASDSFLSLGHSSGNGKSYYTLTHIENILLRTASTLTPDQACKSYPRANRLNKLLSAKVITMPVSQNNDEGQLEEIKINNLNQIKLHHEQEEMDWSEDFTRLVSAILSAVEQCLIRQCARAMRVTSWQRMDIELRNKIQKLACLTEAANNTSIEKLSSRSSISKVLYIFCMK
jgi:BTB/POZ domain-containing protein 8